MSQPQESTLAAISMDTICPGYKQAYIELKSGERIALGNTGNKQEKRIKGMVLKEEKDGVMILPGDSLADKAVAVEKSWIVVPRGGEYFTGWYESVVEFRFETRIPEHFCRR